MSDGLELDQSVAGQFTLRLGNGQDLWTYAFEPGSPANESPRPYFHPLYSIDGDVLTNWRPNDHPWHHGLSFTLTAVDGVNFWGGPSHRAADGYQWRGDHGAQRHRSWKRCEPACLVEGLRWVDPQRNDLVLIEEERTLATAVHADGWSLRWTSRLHNPNGTALRCDNYHSLGGLAGSHYSGLQFRGARGLLDQHGDRTIGLRGAEGASDVETLHGKSAPWVEWHAQHDGSLRRSRVRFESLSGPVPWFLRPADPLVAFAPHAQEPWILSAGQTRELDHQLHFFRA